MVHKNIQSLRPIDEGLVVFHPPPVFVWLTILMAWLLSLLPWRLWPESPDILLVMLALWCAYSVKGVGLTAAFIFGLLIDVHSTSMLGRHALYYVLVLYAVIVVRDHMMQFSVFSHFMAMLPIFVVAAIPVHLLEAWLEGVWVGWGWLWSSLFTALLWFLADATLKIFSRETLDDTV